MESITAGILGVVFTAGLLSFFSPCILPLLPVYISSLTSPEAAAFQSPKAPLARALAFVIGLSLPLFLLGLGAGVVGHIFESPAFFLFCGILVVIFGLGQSGLIPLTFFKGNLCAFAPIKYCSGMGAFALGFLFSFGWTPCTGPLLVALLGLAVQRGDPLDGGLVLLAYSLGLGLPFVIIALSFQQLFIRIKKMQRFFPIMRATGGILLAIMGGWMIATQIEHW